MTDEHKRRGASAGNILAGVFLILLALCLILAGGGCSVMLLAVLVQAPGSGDLASMVPLLLLSLGVLAGGVTAMWFGVRLIAGKYE
jgi:hypothetical protein